MENSSRQIKPVISLIALVVCGTASNNSFSMLEKLTFPPMIQPINPAITEQRQRITQYINDEYFIKNDTLTKIADAVVVRQATSREKPWRCFGYAIAHTTKGSTTPLILGNNATTSIKITDFFEQTQIPKHNDLIVFTKKRRIPYIQHAIQHFGFRVDEGKTLQMVVESKWGEGPEIIQHTLFTGTPHIYGNAATFWTLKPEFTTPQGYKQLHKMIQIQAGYDGEKLKLYKQPPQKLKLDPTHLNKK